MSDHETASREQRVEALAAAIWAGEKAQAPHLYEATYADETSTYRRVTEAAVAHAMDSPAMRDLLAEAKADALREAAEAVTLYGEPTITEMVRAWLRDRATAANPYRETSNGGSDD